MFIEESMSSRSEKHMAASQEYMNRGKRVKAIQHFRRSMELEFGILQTIRAFFVKPDPMREAPDLTVGDVIPTRPPDPPPGANELRAMCHSVHELYDATQKFMQALKFFIDLNAALNTVDMKHIIHDMNMPEGKEPALTPDEQKEVNEYELSDCAYESLKFGGPLDNLEQKLAGWLGTKVPQEEMSKMTQGTRKVPQEVEMSEMTQIRPFALTMLLECFKEWTRTSTLYFEVLLDVSQSISDACTNMKFLNVGLEKGKRNYHLICNHHNTGVNNERQEEIKTKISKFADVHYSTKENIPFIDEARGLISNCIQSLPMVCMEHSSQITLLLSEYQRMVRHLILAQGEVYANLRGAPRSDWWDGIAHTKHLFPSRRNQRIEASLARKVLLGYEVIYAQGMLQPFTIIREHAKHTKNFAEILVQRNDKGSVGEVAEKIKAIDEGINRINSFERWEKIQPTCKGGVRVAITYDDIGKAIKVENGRLYISRHTKWESNLFHQQLKERVVRWPFLRRDTGKTFPVEHGGSYEAPRDFIGEILEIRHDIIGRMKVRKIKPDGKHIEGDDGLLDEWLYLPSVYQPTIKK